jgi:hypothetical protein
MLSMTERDLVELWNKARLHIVLAQLAPTFLLIVTVWLLSEGLGEADALVRFAALGILLASGILGALAQYSAATEALAVSKDLAAVHSESQLVRQVARFGPWMNVVRFVTPAIFAAIFALIFLALL